MLSRVFLILLAVVTVVAACNAQSTTSSPPKKAASEQAVSAAKSSPAYAEIILRRTERESELEEFLLDYTEEFPKVKEIRFEINLLQKETEKILAVSPADAGKLTLALGKLIIRKVELETDLWNLRRQYADEHAEVKRAKRKIEVFERAVKEILP